MLLIESREPLELKDNLSTEKIPEKCKFPTLFPKGDLSVSSTAINSHTNPSYPHYWRMPYSYCQIYKQYLLNVSNHGADNEVLPESAFLLQVQRIKMSTFPVTSDYVSREKQVSQPELPGFS